MTDTDFRVAIIWATGVGIIVGLIFGFVIGGSFVMGYCP